ncbi:LUD domain-containing protein [Sphaerisporangium rubeum]|uniref:L-lactate dehydrogenase complex protein LldG n=1 Tax=Sphaerisporangium rubeum TaxID=321317 RepID=A0A7X0M868_9ACTN|nr:LUD domain-containing protein [Sphaerisporangium rubeum]MBB6475295.1 L-lactate dehydrogenase complex protein LldG [Sphaerisporangium rubeum]
MSSSRDRILAAVRAAVAGAPEVPSAGPHEWVRPSGGLLELFVERLRDYRAVVHVVPAEEVRATVAEVLGERRVVVPEGFPPDWLPSSFLRDEPPLSVVELDRVDGVVSTCAVAVAETGTIVLDGGPGQGRRALTLLPDYHLCVLTDNQIVPSLSEAVAALDPHRPLTWISGPSATSDIELNRVEGVHGPRTLNVIVATRRTTAPDSP